MGKIWMPGGGGGADLDVITVTDSSDVLAGKVIVDRDGNPLTGTLELTGDASDSQVLAGKTYYNTNAKSKRTGSMINQGAINQSLNAGNSYTIPAGYHNGGGKIEANSLASQTSGTATAAQILSGQTAWVNGGKLTGAMPIQGADVSGTDRAWATNMSNWEGTVNLGVRNGYYLNGVNWIQGSLPNYSAGNIKKGVNMGGVVGAFEGYVPTATDLYLRGNNVAGWVANTSGLTLDAGQITILSSGASNSMYTNNSYNMTGYTKFNIETNIVQIDAGQVYFSVLFRLSSSSFITIGTIYSPSTGSQVLSFDLSAFQANHPLQITIYRIACRIYRVWLS